jgi:hypothetical protein
VNEFIDTPGRNVMLLAYGQTGTGKTHTIFGKKEAALDMDNVEEWGVFPKVVSKTFKMMQEKGSKYKLYISCLEFYLMMCCDLLDKNSKMKIDKFSGPVGGLKVEIKSMEDLVEVMKTVFKHRTAAATRMNQKSKEHSGSSRSHACMILYLYQKTSDDKFQATEFHLLDLAGAERPDKLGVERKGAYEVMIDLMKGKKPEIQDQGFMINYELAELKTCATIATEAHAKGKKFSVSTSLTPPAIQYIS